MVANPLRIVSNEEFRLPTRTHYGEIWECGPFSFVVTPTYGTLQVHDLYLSQAEGITGQKAKLRDTLIESEPYKEFGV